ncbi:MAG TPA: glucoamylase family protein [Thermotogota bacterium]|nr:glucoamylase family protein [Thermotogota bacterium]
MKKGVLVLFGLCLCALPVLGVVLLDFETLPSLDADGTGAKFSLSNAWSSGGKSSLQIVPSGQAEETKLSFLLSGDGLASFREAQTLVLDLHVSSDSSPVPTTFFLGMADITNGWQWVDGIFSPEQGKAGTLCVRFFLPEKLLRVKTTGKYRLYLAFFNSDASGAKIPLQHPFWIDEIRLEGIEKEQEESNMEGATTNQSIQTLLQLGDEALLEEIQRRTFLYFWEEANPENGLVRDRSTVTSPCSIAAVGFALAAIPVGIEHGWIDPEQGLQRVLTTLRTFAGGNVEGRNGFFYHFVSLFSGERVGRSELSSIDTTLLLAGAMVAAGYFQGTEVEQLTRQLLSQVDWHWMRNGKETLSMGWHPETGFIDAHWNAFNEGLLAYTLAIGSLTDPLDPSAWDAIERPRKGTFISLPEETLFVYQYPQVFVDYRNKRDAYTNYFENAVIASRYNRQFTRSRRAQYATYDESVWGLSASDGPYGYRAYGASERNHDGTIAPHGSIGSIVFTPEESMECIRAMLQTYGDRVWGKYGFVSAINAEQNWYSEQFIGIDQGLILLMIENYRTGKVWEWFGKNPEVQRWLDAVGFVDQP